ncbi:MAG: restriction endonuclease subunit S, partial [Deltaproteobacteria bacterium]|nr:restriction endonuclease subunit S [Deltaproteobacteria bacterium]
AEQRRIVAKVDELMKLCDELEATQQKRERLRDRLITASLTKLTDERENKSILNFSVSSACSAVSRPEHIHQLRQTILNLAVRGKLATQDPNDEPAEELLRRIETEKQRLISEGIIKKVNPLSPVLENEHPFELPQSWLWERFGNIATIQSNLVKPQDYPNHPHIAPDNIESKTGKLLPYVTVAESRVSSAKHLFFPKNIIYSKIRPNLAKAAVVDFEGLCSADAYPIYSLLNIQYLLRFMLSEVFIQQSVKEDNRVAMPKINQESLNKILVAVPPLAEQHRIVEKVDELMAICDELETRITKTKNTQHQLLEATLYEAIEGQRHQI